MLFIHTRIKYSPIVSFHPQELPVEFLIVQVGQMAISVLRLPESEFSLTPFLKYGFTGYGIQDKQFLFLLAH
jgi:hypothetical protein